MPASQQDEQHIIVLKKFYDSLQQGDYPGLATCYYPEAAYLDPVFGELKGERALAMWRMICANPPKVSYGNLWASEQNGGGSWEARYNFTKTGRPVHNKLTSDFSFKDNLIIRQHDTFDVHAWATMALGWPGRLLGWSSVFRAILHRQATQLLNDFTASNPKPN